MRIPALPLERLVAERIARALGDPIGIIATASLHVEAHEIERLHDRCASLAGQLRERPAAHLADLVASVHVEAQRIVVRCATATLAAALEQRCSSHPPATIALACEDVVARSGRALRLVDRSRAAPAAEPDRTLVRLIVQARQLWAELRRGELDVTALAARERVSPSYLTRVVRLAFLSPAVVETIVSGRLGHRLTAAALTLRGEWPADWSDQKAAFL